ncbi:hypothetical protein L9F63_004665, partial [Diploptera punctata]
HKADIYHFFPENLGAISDEHGKMKNAWSTTSIKVFTCFDSKPHWHVKYHHIVLNNHIIPFAILLVLKILLLKRI